ncbi:MAG: acyl-CoA thioesterase [Gemmatimonadota bacterium]|nr:acyl-CoA thioesterase [Gemmatimonadota bacterium]MDH3366620.1 acyl-CoA thioesterase [Gemmatimonadota bacterium]MDH3476854.1 acyl-CoA thioesterase [Gemmatimonadota bacterium]MDH3569897.1 acyl-CoA thioesterase [Gemmatimonadota bacterium]MDH5548478.1 acyl-CoA thioesterase [Gemmatimonadota bacterium]
MTEPDLTPRPVSASHTTMTELMMPHMANVLGNVFGGVILSLVDRVAAVAAIRHAGGPCVTVSVDQVDFKEPIHVGELVVAKASVNYVGRTSMEVGVHIHAEDVPTGKQRHTNTCYVTFVAIDKEGRPRRVASVVPESSEERRRYAEAEARRASRRRHLEGRP